MVGDGVEGGAHYRELAARLRVLSFSTITQSSGRGSPLDISMSVDGKIASQNVRDGTIPYFKVTSSTPSATMKRRLTRSESRPAKYRSLVRVPRHLFQRLLPESPDPGALHRSLLPPAEGEASPPH